jgi:hypothetical protein
MVEPAPAVPTPQVTYWAISLFSSRTFWVNAAALVVAVLSATEVVPIIPLRVLPLSTALVAALNIWLRTITVRPAAIIAPGTTQPVRVTRIDPPTPPVITD